MRIFITQIVPKDKIIECGLSPAGCNFSYNLISGNGFDKVYSILPPFVTGKRKFNTTGNISILYSSLRCNKVFRRVAPIIENIQLFRFIENNANIWLYNITFLNITLFILLRLFKPKVKIYTIVLDFIPGSKKDAFCLKFIKNSNGLICLANSPLFENRNKIYLPGVVPNNSETWPTLTISKKSFLISGTLDDRISSLSMLLKAFALMPEFELHITGIAPNLKLIESYTSKYNNIIYHGMVEYSQYLDILHDTPFLLSTRDPFNQENQCNFPSKVIEALLHNRIIISSIHYEQLNGIKYFEISTELEKFIEGIKYISNLSTNELLQYANQANLVKRLFNTDVWNNSMVAIESNNVPL